MLHAHKLGLGGLVLAQHWTCGVVGVRKNHTFLFSLAARGVSRFQVFGGRARLFHSTASSFPFLSSVFLRPVRDTLQTDNCAREGKNSIVAKWSCQAVAKGKRLRYAVAMIYFQVWFGMALILRLSLFPTCQVRVVRFYHSCSGSFSFTSSSSSSFSSTTSDSTSTSTSALPTLRQSLRQLPRAVGTAGPQLPASNLSGHGWTSTARF